jgi:2-hydroxychromene-2-carboxylate isomerase
MATSVDWYFDFVSPFSYISLHRLPELDADINFKPVLFAGLLQHWGQKGPAEIPAKRRWTYRWCTWWARELGIPFRFPAEHPFNPLQHLRLALACGSEPAAVKRIFDSVWMSGGNATDAARFQALCRELKADPAARRASWRTAKCSGAPTRSNS